MHTHHHAFTTTTRGLDRTTPPMRLFEKAKRFGIWNPGDIDFRQDAADWQHLSPLEQEVLLHLTALFQAGEEAVTADILPLLLTVAAEGRLEEELYLTTFLFEEAKHPTSSAAFSTKSPARRWISPTFTHPATASSSMSRCRRRCSACSPTPRRRRKCAPLSPTI